MSGELPGAGAGSRGGRRAAYLKAENGHTLLALLLSARVCSRSRSPRRRLRRRLHFLPGEGHGDVSWELGAGAREPGAGSWEKGAGRREKGEPTSRLARSSVSRVAAAAAILAAAAAAAVAAALSLC